nr:MAG: cation transporter [Pseudomonadota bacterium]
MAAAAERTGADQKAGRGASARASARSSGHGHRRHGHGAHGHGGHGAHGHGHHGHGHGHAHAHDHDHSTTPRRALGTALAITLAFMVVEVGVGVYANSLALIADAGHMLADAGALALALVASRFAERPRTQRTTYGLRRAEVLAAFVNGMALAGVAVLIVKEAVERWLEPVVVVGTPMLLTAAAGLVVNLGVALLLLRSQKSSINVRAAFAHVLSDALGSCAAILAGLAVVFFGWYRADPVLSIAIALLVAYSGYRVLRETSGILLESAPPHLDVGAIERTILDCKGVAEVHDLHVWRISDRFDTLTAHVVLERGSHGTDVCRAVAERLERDYGLDHVTIQPEAPPPDELVRVRRSRDGAPLSRAG